MKPNNFELQAESGITLICELPISKNFQIMNYHKQKQL